ncbi:hypothetical protein [Prochlorococcus sp. MIT 1341]|uniref:hypothetical protein n=1 Tax=Prochlorococcus sp. MIT 1341 TaxID=3096221 RepID=UPI002A751DD8|nr:hypothetical protein [Prochlorococcus sp. MIT 1341]
MWVLLDISITLPNSPITEVIPMKKIFFGISYATAWIIASLGLGMIINIGLIRSGAYVSGDSAETIVFCLVGLLALGGAYSLYGEVFSKESLEEDSKTDSISD